MPERICSVNGCEKTAFRRDMCAMHWNRWRRNGDPLALRGRLDLSERRRWLRERFDVDDTDECIRLIGTTSEHYASVAWYGTSRQAHVVVCEWANGPCPPQHEAAHSCGNKWCVNRRHLRWTTHAENMADRVAHGTANRGRRHGMVRLTEGQVREIRARVAAGEQQTTLAREIGVHKATVNAVILRKTWDWLD